MDELQIEYRELDSLIPYAKNARTHSEEQILKIAGSIKAFGWTNPILVDGENGVIAGHGRIAAARKLGMSMVPVIELAGMSENDKRAYVIADNKLALDADWNTELLSLELGDLAALDFDIELTGFTLGDLEQLNLKVETGEVDRDKEWEDSGMPEFDNPDATAYQDIVMHFRNQEDVVEFGKLIGQGVTDKTKWLWFPKLEIDNTTDIRIVADES